MGSAEFSSVILEDLAAQEDMEVVALFTQPHRPVGRKQLLTPPHTFDVATRLGIDVYQPQMLSSSENLEILRALKPDFIVVAAYGQILKQEILSLAPCINLHTSLLPRHRGAAALQETLLQGERYSGVTAIRMNRGLDTGDLLGWLYFSHTNEAKTGCLLKKLGFMAARLVKGVMRNFSTLKPLMQLEADADYARKITKDDGLVDFGSAEKLYRKYQAYDPWPGIFLQDGLKLKEIELLDAGFEHQCGVILQIVDGCADVGCGRGALRIKTVQAASKNQTDAASYLRGKRLGVGDSFS